MVITINPYLNFNGSTTEAMKFYNSILGGELSIQTFGDANIWRKILLTRILCSTLP